MVGTRWQNTSSSRIYLKQAFPRKQQPARASGGTFDHHYWWAQPQGSIDLCLEDTLYKMRHTIVFVDVA